MSNYAELFVGRKTLAKFEELKDRLECKTCNRTTLVYEPPNKPRDAPGGKIICDSCGKFQDWMTLEKNEAKRQSPKYDVDAIWAKYANRCSFCGIHKKHIELFGIGYSMTVQHAPPLEFWVEGDFQGVKIPCCSWCQQQMASWQKRLKTLVEKLVERWDMKK